jgi:hypothetical protein
MFLSIHRKYEVKNGLYETVSFFIELKLRP